MTVITQRTTVNGRDESRTDWDKKEVIIADAVRTILEAIGEDPERGGLKETPRRVARFWRDFVNYDRGQMAVFDENVGEGNDLIAVRGMKLWSLCEHHLLPFTAIVSAGYLSRGKVLGLSKFARIAQHEAHKLQVQERMARSIADTIAIETGSPDVAVVVQGEHTCVSMRGVRTPSTMHTSVMKGQFRYHAPLKDEFLKLMLRAD